MIRPESRKRSAREKLWSCDRVTRWSSPQARSIKGATVALSRWSSTCPRSSRWVHLARSSPRRHHSRDIAIMITAIPSTPVQDRLFDAPAQEDDQFGIYIHVPFCSHICPYCDFNTYAGQSARIPAYVKALQRDAAHWGKQFDGRSAASVFLGGGTPSLLAPIQIKAILNCCESVFDLAPGHEVTIEANPNDLDEKYCSALLESGVNR